MPIQLNGVFEKVGYSNNTSLLLHINNQCENYPIHWHTATEIIMPLESTYSVTMNRINYALKEGDILIIPPGELHELYAPENGIRIIFLFDTSLIRDLGSSQGLFTVLNQPRLITKETFPEIWEQERNLLLQIKQEYINASPLWEASIYSMIIKMFVLIGRNHIDSGTLFPDVRAVKQKEYIDKFNKIIDYIDHNYTEDLTLDRIADIAGFSKFHFSRLFKQFADTSFYDYLNLRRIKCAETLLLNPDLAITEVALQSGFSSISTFNRVFKTLKKCTPSEFKDLYRWKNRS
ncbi:MAG: helix-turn-helix domain-containing protein [Lachnospiraceae bacterium]|nr:helix-turn-helix domain-containing protein [Lachnospiraceae bacterium]